MGTAKEMENDCPRCSAVEIRSLLVETEPQVEMRDTPMISYYFYIYPID